MRADLVVYGPLGGRSGGYRYDPKLADELRVADDDVTAVSLPRRPYRKQLRDNVIAVRRLRALGMDALLQDELCRPSLVGVDTLLDDETPVVSVVHHSNLLERFQAWRRHARRAVETRYLCSTSAFVFNSEATKRTVAAVIDPDPNVVAHSAGDRFVPFSVPLDDDEVQTRAADGPLCVVAVYNLEPWENVDDSFRGFARTYDDRKLTIVGVVVGTGYAGLLSALAVARGIDDRVMFAGRFSDVGLTATFRESHLFALPSHYEGFGIAAVEVIRFGLSALVSSVGGANEFVTHHEDGFLVDPIDPVELTDAVAPLCRGRRRLQSLTISTRDRFLAYPTWDETATTVRPLLFDIVGDAD